MLTIFRAVRKAFDTLDHQILQNNLKYHDVLVKVVLKVISPDDSNMY